MQKFFGRAGFQTWNRWVRNANVTSVPYCPTRKHFDLRQMIFFSLEVWHRMLRRVPNSNPATYEFRIVNAACQKSNISIYQHYGTVGQLAITNNCCLITHHWRHPWEATLAEQPSRMASLKTRLRWSVGHSWSASGTWSQLRLLRSTNQKTTLHQRPFDNWRKALQSLDEGWMGHCLSSSSCMSSNLDTTCRRDYSDSFISTVQIAPRC